MGEKVGGWEDKKLGSRVGGMKGQSATRIGHGVKKMTEYIMKYNQGQMLKFGNY